MQDQIEQILAHRKRLLANSGRKQGVLVALLLHGLLLAVALFSPRHAPPPPLDIVAVNIVPLQALGVRNPRRPPPRPKAAKPKPPEPEALAVPPEPAQPEPARPEPTKPKPTPEPTQPTTAPPEPSAQDPSSQPSSEGAAQRQGSSRGSALSGSPFGAEVAGIDADFRHDYYVNRMLAMIHSQWVRPAAGEIRTVLVFTIQRNGEITQLEMKESSGHNGFDLAAMRAVRNASPLLPLPTSYQKDTLTVTLIVR